MSRFIGTRREREETRTPEFARGVVRNPGRDSQLADAIRAGDADALKELFRLYYEELLAYAMSVVTDDAVAEDIIQDVFLRIWTGRTEWSPESEGVIRYLYGAVRNRALDRLRSDRRRTSLLASRTETSVSNPVGTSGIEANELAEAISRVVDALPARCREVFVLSRYRRLTQREIAELLGITINTVNVQLGRALQAIRAVTKA